MLKVKICGIKEPADAKAASDLGADMVGAILIPESRRFVGVEQARKIFAAAGDAKKVAVVMPKNVEELTETAHALKPDYMQIHPTIPISELARVKKELGVKLIVVVPVSPQGADLKEEVRKARDAAKVADIILVDTAGRSGGGTGLTHDWNISHDIRDAVDKPVFLAGGLTHSNVADAIRAVHPQGVDVATGVESSPGKKDAELMRKFISAAKGALR